MNTTTTPTTSILLKQEKATPHSIAFKVLDLNAIAPAANTLSGGESPSIKKRLEAYAASEESMLSLEDKNDTRNAWIGMKNCIGGGGVYMTSRRSSSVLMRRGGSNSSTGGGAVSPRIAEERRRRAKERKMALDESQKSHLKEQCERDNQAEEKRRQSEEERIQRVRKHNEKVIERCREQAERRNSSTEQMKTEIEKKLEQASAAREEVLEKVKNIAHYSAEKKKPGLFPPSSYHPTAYDNMPVPTHATIPDPMMK